MRHLKPGRLAAFVVLATILIAGLAAFAVHQFANAKYSAAFEEYHLQFHEETQATKTRLNDVFKQIYQNIRTISLLPTVKAIDRHATNLSDNDKETIQRIYDNTFNNVQISEIYILPENFNPKAIDPDTAKPEVPIASFDSQVSSSAAGTTQADAGKAPQVEDEEYQLLTEQIASLKRQFPDNSKIAGLATPMISGHEVITCDNTEFDNSHVDADRKGIVISVPFFRANGAFAGVVTAIIRTNVIRGFLPERDAALVSPNYGYVVASKKPGQVAASSAAVSSATPDHTILTSEVAQLTTADGNAGWALWAGRPDREFTSLDAVQNIQKIEFGGYAVIAFLALLFIATFTYFQKHYYQPLQEQMQAMLKLSSGDLSSEVEDLQRNDIVGEFNKAIQSFANSLRALKGAELSQQHVIAELGKGLDRMKSGDMSLPISAPFPADMDQLRAAFNEAVLKLQDAMSLVKDRADNIRSESNEIAQASNELSRRTESQAASLEQTTAAVAQISSKVNESVEGAMQARKVADEAKQQVSACEKVVGEAVVAMREIEASSIQINQIIGSIDEIAFQTNLLALNAGVEAARAGDVGRGFAVVASEVRSLAERAALAAKEIKELLGSSQVQVKKGVGLVEKTGAFLSRIVTHIAQVHDAVYLISNGARYQSVALGEVSAAVSQMDVVTQQNAAMVEESTAATQMLVENADSLNVLMDQFVVGVRRAS